MIRHTLKLVPVLGIVIGASACAPVDSAERPDPALAGPAVKVVGEAESCINLSRVRNTLVRSDQVIDFEMSGGKVYRNVLARRCPRLGFERSITYETSINQLCRPQIIYTLDTTGGGLRRGAACSLGDFVPVEYVEDSSDE